VLIIWLEKGNLKILCRRSVSECHRHDDIPHILSILLQHLSSIIKLKRALIQEIAKNCAWKSIRTILSGTELELSFVYQHVTDSVCVALIVFIAIRPQIIDSPKLIVHVSRITSILLAWVQKIVYLTGGVSSQIQTIIAILASFITHPLY